MEDECIDLIYGIIFKKYDKFNSIMKNPQKYGVKKYLKYFIKIFILNIIINILNIIINILNKQSDNNH
jgi:hypothetical protein